MQENPEYHSASAYVYVAEHAFTLMSLWDGVDSAERAGIPLVHIGRALSTNWTATVVALALRNTATLRALIAEARP